MNPQVDALQTRIQQLVEEKTHIKMDLNVAKAALRHVQNMQMAHMTQFINPRTIASEALSKIRN